jgi:putative aldouronate transport system substrate-binding protein
MIEKVFVPIEDAIDKYAPNTKKMLEDYELARDYAYLPDGHIYSLLRVVDTYNERVTKRAWVYQPWLEALNIEMPQTTEEFYNMLVAFKDHDPSGTGTKDVVPFSGALRTNPANNEPESYLLNSFMYYDSNYLEVLEDGETLAFTGFSDGYREGLKFLNKLYNEGLLDKETWTQDRNGLKALTEGSDYNRLGVAAAMYWGHITTEGGIERNGETLRRDLEFVALPVLEGPDGTRNAYDRGMLVNNGKLVITKACKNPDLLVRWADMFFDADGMMDAGYSANIGPEGVGWRRAEEGELTWEGTQAKYVYLRAVDLKQNDNWFQTEPYFESRDFIMSFAQNDASRKEGFGGAETTEKYMPYSALAKKLPFMYPPEDEAILTEYTDLRPYLTDATTGVLSTWRNQFIVGQKDPNNDSHWNDYIKQATRAGAELWLELNQTMFDEYLANKK